LIIRLLIIDVCINYFMQSMFHYFFLSLINPIQRKKIMAKRTVAISITALVLAVFVVIYLLYSRKRFYNEHYMHGKTAVLNGDYQQAAISFKKAIRWKRNSAPAWLGLAQSNYFLKNYDAAMEQINRVIMLDSLMPDAYLYRGMLYAKKTKQEEALADINHALLLDSLYAQAYYQRGLILAGRGDFKGSVTDYRKAMELDKDNIDAYLKSIEARSALDDYKGVISDYDKLLTVDPENENAYLSRGYLKLNLDDLDGAINDFNKTLEINPGNIEAIYNRGVSFAK